MSRFDYDARTPHSVRDTRGEAGQRLGASAPNTLVATIFPGQIRKDITANSPGDRTWDKIDGVEWTISGGDIVDGSLRGQVPTTYPGITGHTCYRWSAPSGDTAFTNQLVANLGSHTGEGTFTIEGWYRKSGGDDGGMACYLYQDLIGTNDALSISMFPTDSGGVNLTLDNDSFVEQLATGTITIPENNVYDRWLHWAVTVDAGTPNIYFNGRRIYEGTTSYDIGTTDQVRLRPSGADGAACGGIKLSRKVQYTGLTYDIPTGGWVID